MQKNFIMQKFYSGCSMEYVKKSMLPGYERQLFNSALVDLVHTYASVTPNGSTLRRVGERITNYLKIDRLTTEDGYSWFWSLHFSKRRFLFRPKWEVTILFQWATRTASGDCCLDRPIVACVRGQVDTAEVDGLVRKVTEALAGSA